MRLVNLARPGVLTEVAFATAPMQVVYPIDSSTIARVEHILDDTGTDINEIPWPQLTQITPHWLRAQGGSFKQWARIGRDAIAIFPAKKIASSVTLIYTPVLPPLQAEIDVVDLREDRLPAVLALAEYLLLLRHRFATSAPVAETVLEAALARLPEAGRAGVAPYDQNG